MRCQNPKESGTCGDERKHKKMKAKSANGALGLLESSIPVSLDVLWRFGEENGVKNGFTPPFLKSRQSMLA